MTVEHQERHKNQSNEVNKHLPYHLPFHLLLDFSGFFFFLGASFGIFAALLWIAGFFIAFCSSAFLDINFNLVMMSSFSCFGGDIPCLTSAGLDIGGFCSGAFCVGPVPKAANSFPLSF